MSTELMEDRYSSSARRVASVRNMLPSVAGRWVSLWAFFSTHCMFPYESSMFQACDDFFR
jgi:hypothetical protein